MAVEGVWLQVSEIVLINLVLSGDNALLIAMATSGLPRRQRRLAMLFGILGALIIRVALTGLAAEVMAVPYVRAFGSLLLGMIALKMVVDEEDQTTVSGGFKAGGLLPAAGTILLADLTMSVDNVAAIAGMAQGNLPLLATGLVISMAFMLLASTGICAVLERFPQLMVVGSAILAWTAGRILAEDAGLSRMAGKSVWGAMAAVGVILLIVALYKSRRSEADKRG